MIARIVATLQSLRGTTAVLEVGPVWYEVFVPTSVAGRLPPPGKVVTLYTYSYIEGAAMGSTSHQRLFGFLDQVEKEFFELLIQVSGLGMKKAARAMALPVSRIAAAIERGDERLLTSLPEIGPKTAKKMIAELQGKMGKFALLRETTPPDGPQPAPRPLPASGSAGSSVGQPIGPTVDEIADECRQVLTNLLNYPDREADQMLTRALVASPTPASADDLLQTIFRLRGTR